MYIYICVCIIGTPYKPTKFIQVYIFAGIGSVFAIFFCMDFALRIFDFFLDITSTRS